MSVPALKAGPSGEGQLVGGQMPSRAGAALGTGSQRRPEGWVCPSSVGRIHFPCFLGADLGSNPSQRQCPGKLSQTERALPEGPAGPPLGGREGGT